MKRLGIVLLLVVLPGCAGGPFGWMKNAKTGTVKETEKHTLIEKTTADVYVTSDPLPLPSTIAGPELDMPQWTYEIMGKTIKAPASAKVGIHVGSNAKESTWSLTEALGNFKATTNVGILIIGGGVATAVGVVLCFFGWLSLGLAVIAFGISMIACGVVIEQYPWVFLIVLGLGLCVGAYLILRIYYARQTATESEDKSTALGEIVKAIEMLPPIEAMNLKSRLAKSMENATIRKVVDKVKGR